MTSEQTEDILEAIETAIGGTTPLDDAELAAVMAQVREIVRERDEARETAKRAGDRIRAWTDGYEPPALEDDDAIGPPDIQELIEAAPRFRGDRAGGPVSISLEVYEAVVSRSEVVAYGRALAWQQQRIAELERERDEALASFRQARAEAEEATREYNRERAENAKLRAAAERLDRDAERAIRNQESAEAAIQTAHVALGGDGEWVARPGQTLPAGETGDLRVDVPALASRLKAENAKLRAALEAVIGDARPDNHPHTLCAHLHHRPGERHDITQPCGAIARVRAALPARGSDSAEREQSDG